MWHNPPTLLLSSILQGRTRACLNSLTACARRFRYRLVCQSFSPANFPVILTLSSARRLSRNLLLMPLSPVTVSASPLSLAIWRKDARQPDSPWPCKRLSLTSGSWSSWTPAGTQWLREQLRALSPLANSVLDSSPPLLCLDWGCERFRKISD